jgi:quinol-cytochrome oxidoreductase complex cytochrome b subunit
VVVALVVLPYVDRRPGGTGRWFAPERRVANTIFVALVMATVVLTIVGTLFRGPNWGWVWPW